MTWTEAFVRDGMVVVDGALDPAVCDSVVARRLAENRIDEGDPTTWPTGWRNLPPNEVFPIAEVAPTAAEVLGELVGGIEACRFVDLPDNLILNGPDPASAWWSPEQWDAPGAGWHKDGDWFRHFLDSPEQGLLTIVFWRDVVPRQGATYLAVDSVGPVARLLAEHPEGLSPADLAGGIARIMPTCRDIRELTGRQGTIVFAHPFMVHSSSVNTLDRLRIISNSSVMLAQPMRFDRADGGYSAVERSILAALDVERLDYRPTGARGRIVPERERSWKAATPGARSTG